MDAEARVAKVEVEAETKVDVGTSVRVGGETMARAWVCVLGVGFASPREWYLKCTYLCKIKAGAKRIFLGRGIARVGGVISERAEMVR